MILDAIAETNLPEIQQSNYGTFATQDPEADGYYVVQWTSLPYVLEEERELGEFDPPIVLQPGELVCDATYFNRVPRAARWYTPSEMKTVVRLRQVLKTDLILGPVSDKNKLPNTCQKTAARRLGAVKVASTDHDSMLDEIARRAMIDHEENWEWEDVVSTSSESGIDDQEMSDADDDSDADDKSESE